MNGPFHKQADKVDLVAPRDQPITQASGSCRVRGRRGCGAPEGDDSEEARRITPRLMICISMDHTSTTHRMT